MVDPDSPRSSTQPGKHRYRDYVDLAFAVMFPPILAYLAYKDGVRAPGELALFTAGVPFFLLGLRAFNRLHHPDHVPARWPKNYPRGERIQQLSVLSSLCVIVAISLVIFFDNETHHLFHYLWWGFVGWNAFLTRYIQERRFIPPSRPPFDPSQSWSARNKPLRSDHWGQRNTPSSEGA